jgi:hypothetical protein
MRRLMPLFRFRIARVENPMRVYPAPLLSLWLSVTCAIAEDYSSAIWERHPVLACTVVRATSCEDDRCGQRTIEMPYRLDFTSGTVENQRARGANSIIEKVWTAPPQKTHVEKALLPMMSVGQFAERQANSLSLWTLYHQGQDQSGRAMYVAFVQSNNARTSFTFTAVCMPAR